MTAPAVPLVEELIPCPDPWDVARKLAHLPHLLFLDSSERGGERGRYSYVMAEPTEWWSDTIVPHALEHPRYSLIDPFTRLKVETAGAMKTVPELPPFQGGVAGLFGYDLNRQLERIPVMSVNDLPVPILAVGQYNWVICWDHVHRRAWLLWRGKEAKNRVQGIRKWLNTPPPPTPPELTTSPARGEVEEPTTLFTSPLAGEFGGGESRRRVGGSSLAPQHPLPHHPGVSSNFSREGYIEAVRKAVEYVHAGDVFQVNISQRLLAPMTEHPLDLYGRLRQVSPSPFGCYFDLGDFQIVSASPERFLQVNANGEVSTRPIKGTRPRGKTPAEDAALIHDLTTNPKDRAENVMIVDLLRNDLGRVCEYGSVTVPKVCEVESFSHVHHLVSEVRGKLRAGLTPFDLLRAAFPGGSVTGAPKVRAMEIIAELEPTARGPYCGSVGWIGFDGAMDTNILIRTFTAGRGWLQFPVGGGIVADSDPATEYEETLHKAAGLLRALKP